jgi:hypothetical protein
MFKCPKCGFVKFKPVIVKGKLTGFYCTQCHNTVYVLNDTGNAIELRDD